MERLQNKLMILLFFSIAIFLNSYCQKDGYPVMFAIDGVQQRLNNDFKIYFVYMDSIQTVCYQPIVYDSNYISFPSQMSRDTNIKYHVLFVYKNKVYYCDYSDYTGFTKVPNRALLIHFQRKPFNKFVHWGNYKYNIFYGSEDSDDYSKSKVVGKMEIVYGIGDFAATYTEIYSFKDYFKKGKEILKQIKQHYYCTFKKQYLESKDCEENIFSKEVLSPATALGHELGHIIVLYQIQKEFNRRVKTKRSDIWDTEEEFYNIQYLL